MEYIIKFWPIIIASIFFVAAIFAVWKYKFPDFEKRLGKIEDKVIGEVRKTDIANFVLKKEIYEKDGSTRYQHRSGCTELQHICQKTICAKVDEVKAQLGEMDRSREETRKDMTTLFNNVHDQQIEMVKVATQVHTLFANKQDQQIKSIVTALVKELGLKPVT
jgi:hypothetical protein